MAWLVELYILVTFGDDRILQGSILKMIGRFGGLRARGFSFSFVLGVGVMESRLGIKGFCFYSSMYGASMTLRSGAKAARGPFPHAKEALITPYRERQYVTGTRQYCTASRI